MSKSTYIVLYSIGNKRSTFQVTEKYKYITYWQTNFESNHEYTINIIKDTTISLLYQYKHHWTYGITHHINTKEGPFFIPKRM